MSGRYLLDTNLFIALFASEPAVTDRFGREQDVFVSVVVLGELFYGADNSSRPAENRGRLEALAAENTVLGCGLETARIFGGLKHRLRVKGRPIPANDLWIAATAIEHGLVLATRDEHFADIDGLDREAW